MLPRTPLRRTWRAEISALNIGDDASQREPLMAGWFTAKPGTKGADGGAVVKRLCENTISTPLQAVTVGRCLMRQNAERAIMGNAAVPRGAAKRRRQMRAEAQAQRAYASGFRR